MQGTQVRSRSGKILQPPGHLSPCATTIDPMSLNYWNPRARALQWEKPPQREDRAPRLERSLCWVQRDKAHTLQVKVVPNHSN